jgi:dTDP-4-dehydrorhamnose reductase
MKTLVLGHKGLLGSYLSSIIPEAKTIPYRYPSVEFEQNIIYSKYNIIINCIVDKLNNETVNIDLPYFLSKHCDYLVQFSSDAVFSGKKPIDQQYLKEDKTDPICIYGNQKDKMEQSLQHTLSKSLIIRTSFLDKKSQFIQSVLTNNKFSAYKNYIWSGLSCQQVADLTLSCIQQHRTGMCHMFSKNALSKYELALRIAQNYNSQTEIIPVEFPVINRSINSDFDISFNLKDLIQ